MTRSCLALGPLSSVSRPETRTRSWDSPAPRLILPFARAFVLTLDDQFPVKERDGTSALMGVLKELARSGWR